MKKTITLFTLLLVGIRVSAQQDPMFTKYMFNSLIFNPAYAGSKDHMIVNLLHRTQWWGIEGAPQTQSLTIHTPMKNDRVGLGGSLVFDQIGPTTTISGNLAYSYRIPVGKGKLCIGVQGGGYNWRADWGKLQRLDPGDPAYQFDVNIWRPNLGTGIYYYNNYFYTGIGCPRIIEYDLTKDRTDNSAIYAKQYRHYFYTIGAAIPLKGNALIFKPSALVKSVGLDSKLKKDAAFDRIGAPTEFNVDLSLFFQETLWVGTSFRSAVEVFTKKSTYDSVDLWFAYYLSNGVRIGAAYDYTLTKLQRAAGGSFEIMAGYEFNYQTRKTVTPRYF
ncbi:MAG: hypothetical protein RL329_1799 [Bacteroidota bacterium]|jgi:type IX secretion system PorP/SprF family membrane protein